MTREKTLFDAVLAFPVQPGKVLLALKMRAIGAGRLNGYGGGIKPGETPLQAMIREMREEALVRTRPRDYVKVAVIKFHNTKTDGSSFVCRVNIYLLKNWHGEFRTTKEMANPKWRKRKRLPLSRLMPADRTWLPLVLSGKKLHGYAKYGPRQKKLLEPMRWRVVKRLAA